MKTKWNKWYAYVDENGNTEWDDVDYETLERWLLEGIDRDENYNDVDEFCDEMIELAIAEQRHMPYLNRDVFFEHCTELIDRWNNEAEKCRRESSPENEENNGVNP